MSGPDLISVGPGFADPVLDSQAAFRSSLAALSAPGTIVALGAGLEAIAGLHAAASALLLALLDQDTRLWLSPGLSAGRTAASLKFHTGCALAAAPGEADFALVAAPEELPSLASFNAGSDEYPERSATVLLQVPALATGGWRLTGPGVKDEARLSVPALGAAFLTQWERNHSRFPRGVDLFLTSGEQLCCLPRTTRIEA
ncbi:MAG: phosphonate C-P lyase system protein PhnH [Candidatus Parcubacteria bacterium]|nr:phosphonate C-P lyase system protein PhnH [Burkholderiales bacterium]